MEEHYLLTFRKQRSSAAWAKGDMKGCSEATLLSTESIFTQPGPFISKTDYLTTALVLK